MVNDWNPRFWLLFSPLHAGLAILLYVSPCHAALLKDIRIGEYDEFTRIVFEFNIHTDVEAIEKIRPGELKITFADVRTEFIRPIPLKYSERLSNFEVWQHEGHLSIIFRFNYKKLRFDNFQLKNPPRMVVDVYQNHSQAEPSGIRSTQIVQKTIPDSDPITQPKNQHAPLPMDRLSQPTNETPSSTPIPDSVATEKPSTVDKQIGIESTSIKPAMPPQQADQEETAKLYTEAIADTAPPVSKKGLQYYLLIALVILTIVILSLLVIMLISRHKWTNGKKALKIEDLLHRQDQHIASINSQIEEHLKQYDEI